MCVRVLLLGELPRHVSQACFPSSGPDLPRVNSKLSPCCANLAAVPRPSRRLSWSAVKRSLLMSSAVKLTCSLQQSHFAQAAVHHRLCHLSICWQTCVADLSILVGPFAIVHGCQRFRRARFSSFFSGFTGLDKRRQLEIILGNPRRHQRQRSATDTRPCS